MHQLTEIDREKFWLLVDQQEDNSCWPWKGSKRYKKYGEAYGNFTYKKHGRYVCNNAHRCAWALHYNNGLLPETQTVIRHKCHNPICCNPKHLIPGTQLDNMQDMVEKRSAI